LDALAALARAAMALEAVDDPALQHVAGAFGQYLAGQADTLDAAMGLPRRRPGERSWRTKAVIDRRNELLREIADRYYSDRCPAAQAQEIATDLSRYASSAWVREREAETCPSRHHGSVREMFWRMLMLRDHVLSERTIRSVLAVSSPY
jgi:hypothetical protein